MNLHRETRSLIAPSAPMMSPLYVKKVPIPPSILEGRQNNEANPNPKVDGGRKRGAPDEPDLSENENPHKRTPSKPETSRPIDLENWYEPWCPGHQLS